MNTLTARNAKENKTSTIQDPTDKQIEAALNDYCGDCGFVVLEIGGDSYTYIQAAGSLREGFVVEYQNGDVKDHWASKAHDVDAKTVLSVVQLYAKNPKGTDWKAKIEWVHDDFQKRLGFVNDKQAADKKPTLKSGAPPADLPGSNV
jgi:hypothetical protein